MARILLIASYEWSRSYHAYQLADGGHLVRSANLSPQIGETITSFQPEVIVANLSDRQTPVDELWQDIAAMSETRPAVIFSTDGFSWVAIHPSRQGKYVMSSPAREDLNKVIDRVLNGQDLVKAPHFAS